MAFAKAHSHFGSEIRHAATVTRVAYYRSVHRSSMALRLRFVTIALLLEISSITCVTMRPHSSVHGPSRF